MNNDSYYYISFGCSNGLKLVGDEIFENKLIKLAKNCKGEFCGAGYGGGVRDFSFTFKSKKSAYKFLAALGRRARMWKIVNRSLSFYDAETDDYYDFEVL